MESGLNLSINQTGSFLICNKKSNFLIYHINRFAKFNDIEQIQDDFELMKIEMYYSSNLLIFIGKTMNTKLSKFIIFNHKNKRIIYEEELDQGKMILNMKINKKHIFILCEDCIYCYGFPLNRINNNLNKEEIPILKNNPRQFTVSEHIEDIIAYSNLNEIIIIHFIKNKTIKIENAHEEEITVLRFNPNSTILASGSKCGKKIRLWNTNDGKTLMELVTTFKTIFYNTPIANLAFSHNSMKFCCVSSYGHIDYINLTKLITQDIINSIHQKNQDFDSNKEEIKGEKIKGQKVTMTHLDQIMQASTRYILSSSSNNDFIVINYQTLKVREIFIGENKAESKMMDLTFI